MLLLTFKRRKTFAWTKLEPGTPALNTVEQTKLTRKIKASHFSYLISYSHKTDNTVFCSYGDHNFSVKILIICNVNIKAKPGKVK